MGVAKPFFLNPYFVEKPWGVDPAIAEKAFDVKVPSKIKKVGEIWWVSGHEDYETGISQIVEEYGEDFTGSELKHILTEPNITGKTEAWYVEHVVGDVKVVADFKPDITKDRYDELLKGKYFDNPDKLPLEEFIQKLKDVFDVVGLTAGQTFIIKPGTVHTILSAPGAYAIISETQQGYGGKFPLLTKTLLVDGILSIQVHPSDEHVKAETREDIVEQYRKEPTIRVSDFGRDRRTQPDYARDIIKFSEKTFSETIPVIEDFKDHTITHLVANKHFAKDLIELAANCELTLDTKNRRFHIIRIIDGLGTIVNEKVQGRKTLAIPASLGAYKVKTPSTMSFFLEYVPNLEEYARDLVAKGFKIQQIKALDGFCTGNDFDFLD